MAPICEKPSPTTLTCSCITTEHPKAELKTINPPRKLYVTSIAGLPAKMPAALDQIIRLLPTRMAAISTLYAKFITSIMSSSISSVSATSSSDPDDSKSLAKNWIFSRNFLRCTEKSTQKRMKWKTIGKTVKLHVRHTVCWMRVADHFAMVSLRNGHRSSLYQSSAMMSIHISVK